MRCVPLRRLVAHVIEVEVSELIDAEDGERRPRVARHIAALPSARATDAGGHGRAADAEARSVEPLHAPRTAAQHADA
jgi:hypothetical protein